MSSGGKRRQAIVWGMFCIVGLVSGCGVVEDTIDGMTGNNETAEPFENGQTANEGLVVEVTVESDAPSTGELTIEIDSPRNSQSLSENAVDAPFKHDFTIPTDIAFPLRNSRVEVDGGPGATYIKCTITVDGDVVSTHRAAGTSATAVCERGLQLGPS